MVINMLVISMVMISMLVTIMILLLNMVVYHHDGQLMWWWGWLSKGFFQEQCDIPEDELDMCHLHTYDTPVTQIRYYGKGNCNAWVLSLYHMV